MNHLTSRYCLFFISAILIFGCSRTGHPGSYVHRITDPDGILVVENGRIPKSWGGYLPLLKLKDVATIGAEQGPDEQLITSANLSVPVALGPEGQVGYVERMPTELRVYDRNGGFLFRAGRRGGGPGEFNFVNSIQFLSGTGWVLFASPYRMIIYDEDGGHVTTRSTRDLTGGPFYREVHLLPDGGMWYWDQDSVNWGTTEGHLIWGNWQSMESREISQAPMTRMEADGDMGWATSFPHSLAVDAKGRAWENCALAYQIEVYDQTNDTRWRVRREFEPVTDPRHRSNRADDSSWWGMMIDSKRIYDRPPEYFPAIKGLQWVNEDELWVFTSTYVDSPMVQVDVFSPEGVYMRAFQANESLRWAKISDGYLWRLTESDSGVPQLIRSEYYLEGRE